MDYGWFVILNGVLYVLIAVFTIPLHVIVAMVSFLVEVFCDDFVLVNSQNRNCKEAHYFEVNILSLITLIDNISRILLSLALADVVQLLFQGIGGLYICMGVPLDDIFNNVMGFCMNGLWGVTLIQHVMLALNRLR